MNSDLQTMLESVITKALQPIQQDIKTMNARLGSLENEVQTVKSQMNHRFDILDLKVANLETKMGTIESKIDNMETKLSQLESEQQNIKSSVLATSETVIRMESIQDGQQRMIDMLSSRSLYQEAELKRIK